ncbi:MAG: S-formylglutathione hydrolase, partial [Parvibaculum sp.]|uniref:alpha/beta hydrolase-fold protein n=1 Tax=Parvibaculum sp. TaxID=2024848 RepID=UPI001B2B6707
MSVEVLSSHRCFGGTLNICRHASAATGTPMRFSVFVPEGKGPFPAVTFLAGLTCTEENFTVKAGAQRVAAEFGLVIVAPDTSPRGDDVPDDAGSYDFAKGAGFYLDATRQPWSKNYRMYSYITGELPS